MQQIWQEYQGQVERMSQQKDSKELFTLVSQEIQKIVTKQDEPEDVLDVEVNIAGMVQAAVAKIIQPALASDSKSTKKVTL